MASKAVMDAVAARLTASWTATLVMAPNLETRAPTGQQPHLIVQYPISKEDHIGLGQVGQRTYRETGVIRLVLNVPRAQGAETAYQWQEQLRALFRGVQFSGVQCIGASPSTDEDNNVRGSWYQMRILVDYYFDLQA